MKTFNKLLLMVFILMSCNTIKDEPPEFISSHSFLLPTDFQSQTNMPTSGLELSSHLLKKHWPQYLLNFIELHNDLFFDNLFFYEANISNWVVNKSSIEGKEWLKIFLQMKKIYTQSKSIIERKVAASIGISILLDSGLRTEAFELLQYSNSILPDSRSILKQAELEFYDNKNTKESLRLLLLVDSTKLNTKRQMTVYSMLKKNLLLKNLDLNKLGINDDNISALAYDGNDIWIGTWNGSVLRHNTTDNSTMIIIKGAYEKTVNAVKSFAVDRFSIYIGMTKILYRFSKRTENLTTILPFENKPIDRIQKLLRSKNGNIYIATLGQGLWMTNGETYIQVCHNLPSNFINDIIEFEDLILLGTMDHGLFQWNQKTDTINQIISTSGDKLPNNITYIGFSESQLWIGTYGSGLYAMNLSSRNAKKIDFGNPQKWILTGTETDRYLFFGTLGEGLLIFNKKNKLWTKWDLSNGGPADVSTLVFSNPNLAIGTLGEGLHLIIEGSSEESLF